MANKIILKRSSVPSKVPSPSDLEVGEIAVNLEDQRLYSKKADGTVILVGDGGGAGSGDVVGPASSTDNAITRFDSTTGKLIQNSTVLLDDNGNISNANAVVLDTTPATLPTTTGTIYWNSGNQTPSAILSADVDLQLGQENVALVYNGTGSTIPNGSVVAVSGAQGQRPSVVLADADSEPLSAGTLGIATQDILNGTEGFVTTFGFVRGLDTSAFTAGQPIWLSQTAGQFTATRPAAPAHTVFLGWAIKIGTTSGEVFVHISNGWELDELHNVLITSPVSGNTLIYDAVAGVWKNANLTAGTGISVTNGAGSITVANTGVLSLTGTTNEVEVSGSTGNVTLSLPTTINANTTGNAATVTNGVYTTDTGTVTNAMLAGSIANNKLLNSAITINGTSTSLGGSINVGTVTSVSGTGSVNGITLSGTVNSSGNLTLGGSLSNVSLTTQVTGTLPATNGGTGQNTYAVGDLLVGGATNTLTKLADVATGNALISGGVGVAPSYGKIGLTTHVSGTLPVANGGTGLTSPGTAGNVLTSNGTAWVSSASPAPAEIKTPTNVSPANSATNIVENPTLTGSTYYSLYGVGMAAGQWQVSTVSNFASTVVSTGDVAGTSVSYTVSAGILSVSTTYYWRVRYKDSNGVYSEWSTPTQFATASGFNNFIPTPTPTPAIGAALEGGFYTGLIWNQVTQSSTSTAIGTGSKTFTVTDAAPLFYSGQAVEVRSRANPGTQRMKGTVTASSGTTLTVNVTSVDGSGTYTDWSIMAKYRVIVAPKSSGENSSIAYKNANTAAPSATGTLTEGRKATLAMVAADTSTVYPAAHYCNNLSIGSYTDWYLPARDELELIWRNLKPATDNNYTTADRPTGATPNYQNLGSLGDTANTHGLNNNSDPQGAAYTSTVPARTSVAAFQTGGAEAMAYGGQIYWSSTEYSTSFAWVQVSNSGAPGFQGPSDNRNTSYVRAVRRSII
jgi:hypothetical protein